MVGGVRRTGCISIAIFACACSSRTPSKEDLGESMFMDPNLSHPAGQACADCHAPNSTFRDPESDHTTSMGVVPGRFGARNAPTLMYARFIPPLHYDKGQWYGGLFHDGRAASLEDQLAGPLLNPIEMNNPDKATVVEAVRSSSYAADFREVFGASRSTTPTPRSRTSPRPSPPTSASRCSRRSRRSTIVTSRTRRRSRRKSNAVSRSSRTRDAATARRAIRAGRAPTARRRCSRTTAT